MTQFIQISEHGFNVDHITHVQMNKGRSVATITLLGGEQIDLTGAPADAFLRWWDTHSGVRVLGVCVSTRDAPDFDERPDEPEVHLEENIDQ